MPDNATATEAEAATSQCVRWIFQAFAKQISGDIDDSKMDRPLSLNQEKRKSNIAKKQNTYAKLKREMEKKGKAEAKRIRRIKRKQGVDVSDSPDSQEIEQETLDAEPKTPDTTD